MRRKISCFLLAMILVSCSYSISFASSISTEKSCDVISVISLENGTKPFKSSAEIKDLGSISYAEAINVNGSTYNLYPTFDDPNKALAAVSEFTGEILSGMQVLYGLPAFDENSWLSYQKKITSYTDYLAKIYSKGDKKFLLHKMIPKLVGFFDIYENTAENYRILSSLQKNSEETGQDIFSVADASVTTEVLKALPYDNAFPVISEGDTSMVALAYSTSNAISYATTWATSHNPVYANYGDDADCTNFVSQIKYAGGTAINYTGNQNTGWWFSFDYTKQSSRSWRIANDFRSYFGVRSNTFSFNTFSDRVAAGSYIGVDYENDGSWDHMGFVTATSTTQYTTNGVTYYNFKVAQHSSDYHAWVNSNTNGWDAIHLDYDTPRYGIIN
jgi:hypothetical protein